MAISCLSLCSSLINASEADMNCVRSIESLLQAQKRPLFNRVPDDSSTGSICRFAGVECWTSAENSVMSIKLSGLGLEDAFPRGIKDCTSLISLDLSRNNFSGALPSDMSALIPMVTYLDLSFNDFSSEIPATLASCSYLNTLRLDNNRFSGQLPPQLALLGRQQFSVANNLLSGPVPTFTSPAIVADNFANNMGLCDSPLDPCQTSSEVRFPTIVKGAVVGAVVFAPIGTGIGWFCFGRKERQRQRRSRSKNKRLQKAYLFPDLHPS